MKVVIDILKKSRFLKSLTWFDYSALIIVFIVALVGFFFFYRKSSYVDIRVKVTDQEVLYAWNYPQNWYADRFKVGDVERDAVGRVVAEIKNIESFNIDQLRKAVYLDLNVKSVYDTRTKVYYSRGKPLAFGTPVRFNFSGITLDGIITEIPNSEYQQNIEIKDSIVIVIVRGIKQEEEPVEPRILESIKKGDKMVDSNGKIIAQVIDIKLSRAERVVENSAGELLLRYDPLYKDALVTLRLRTKIFNEEAYIFDDLPLKAGVEIPLIFKEVSVASKIIDVVQR